MALYIDKAAIVAEIERRIKAIPKDETDKRLRAVYGNEAFVLIKLLSFLDTLEVKEVDLEEEPVSEDLEEEMTRYFSKNPIKHPTDWPALKNTALHFANWQKDKMMAKAVDGEVGYWNIRGLSVNMELPSNFKEGDRVKLIIVKDG